MSMFAKRLIQATKSVEAAPSWQSKVLRALSIVRRPKIEEQTDDRLVCLTDTASVYPALGQLLMKEGLAFEVDPVSGSMIRVTVRVLR